jgi:heat shock protein HslJ
MFSRNQSLCVLAALAVTFLVMGGCGAEEVTDEPQVPQESPTGAGVATAVETEPGFDLTGAWLLEDLSGRGVVDMIQTTIEFDGGGDVFGSGGCNRYTGSYSFEGGKLDFGPLAGTKMMCPKAVMDQEDRFLQALGGVKRVEMDGPFLLIFHEGSNEPLRFTKVEGEIEL